MQEQVRQVKPNNHSAPSLRASAATRSLLKTNSA